MAHLKKMKLEGVDLNAIRHGGTLLDHAIRDARRATFFEKVDVFNQRLMRTGIINGKP